VLFVGYIIISAVARGLIGWKLKIYYLC
jgi:hypothetical protein